MRFAGLLAGITLAGCGIGANDTSTGRTSGSALSGDSSGKDDGTDKGTASGGGGPTKDGDPCGDLKSLYEACVDAKAPGCDDLLVKLKTCDAPPPPACGACQDLEASYQACTLKPGADCQSILSDIGTCLAKDAQGGSAGGGGGPSDPCEAYAEKYKACLETTPGSACDAVLDALNQCEASQTKPPPPPPPGK